MADAADDDDNWDDEPKKVDPFALMTPTDVHLGAAYFPLLVELAAAKKGKKTIAYSELVARAKRRYPDNPIVQNAIPVSTGRRLEVVKIFTDQRNLPDLASLVVGKDSGEVGPGYRFDPVAARAAVFAFDWSTLALDFDAYAEAARIKVATPPVRKITPQQARNMVYAYYSDHKATLPKAITAHAEHLRELVLKGIEVERAFEEVVRAMRGEAPSPS